MRQKRNRKRNMVGLLGPGILLAATGVGAGDLAGAGFAGSKLGYAVLWAVVLGAIFKYILTEGLARWQIATGRTILEGVCHHFGRFVVVTFIGLYFLLWTYVVGGAMISACGVAAQSLIPIGTTLGDSFESADIAGKVIYGLTHSIVGLALVWFGGFKLFERVMGVCIGLMFITVVVTAIMIGPDWASVAKGLLVPTIPHEPGALAWTIALLGGIGGTVTLLSYGYWIRETDRDNLGDMRACRLDLALGYTVTAIFGIALIIIATGVSIDGRGIGLIVALANRLGEDVGPIAKWLFLLGAWGAVFSSLLGVWQSVPYIFADAWRLVRPLYAAGEKKRAVDTKAWPYRGYLIAIAILPLGQLLTSFKIVSLMYAVIGAVFLPLLALTLLMLNTRASRIGDRFKNSKFATTALVVVLAFASYAGFEAARRALGPADDPQTTATITTDNVNPG